MTRNDKTWIGWFAIVSLESNSIEQQKMKIRPKSTFLKSGAIADIHLWLIVISVQSIANLLSAVVVQ